MTDVKRPTKKEVREGLMLDQLVRLQQAKQRVIESEEYKQAEDFKSRISKLQNMIVTKAKEDFGLSGSRIKALLERGEGEIKVELKYFAKRVHLECFEKNERGRVSKVVPLVDGKEGATTSGNLYIESTRKYDLDLSYSHVISATGKAHKSKKHFCVSTQENYGVSLFLFP